MSFAEILTEIPRFTRAQRLELLREVLKMDDAGGEGGKGGLHAQHVNGSLLLVGPRVVRQEEVDAILEEFP